jgi:short-subunit dehydrogenase
MPTPTC